MIENVSLLEAFERSMVQERRPDYFRSLRIFEALYQEAKHLGVFPLKDPLEGIDVDIRLGKVLNVRAAAGKDRPGPG